MNIQRILRIIFTKARVMRDLKNVDMKAVGKSKEYAFVSFTTHDDALQALRSINNNPNVFTPKRVRNRNSFNTTKLKV